MSYFISEVYQRIMIVSHFELTRTVLSYMTCILGRQDESSQMSHSTYKLRTDTSVVLIDLNNSGQTFLTNKEMKIYGMYDIVQRHYNLCIYKE